MSARDLLETAFGPDFNLYSTILKLSSTPKPSSAQIRKAYHKRALEFHPDKQIHKSADEIEVSKLKFQAVSLAYEILSNEKSREAYDENGDIYDDGDDFEFSSGEAGVEQWKEVFSKMFGKVTTTDISNFEQKYKKSDEERQDVLKYYKICKGNFAKMLTCVMLSEDEDVPRWKKDYIEPAIAKQEIPRLHDDEDETDTNKLQEEQDSNEDDDDTVTESDEEIESGTTKSKATSKPTKKKNQRPKATSQKKTKLSKKEKEAKEAAELMAKIQQNAIARRGQSFGSLMSSLESRYANTSKSSSKKKGSKKKGNGHMLDPPDIPDDEFERIQAGFKKKQNPSKRVIKKRSFCRNQLESRKILHT